MRTEPEPSKAEQVARWEWSALSTATRRAALKQARKGRTIEDPIVRKAALGWAKAVLGLYREQTNAGRLSIAGYLAANALLPEGSSGRFVDVFDGAARHDMNPCVRHVARKVLRNLE